MTDLIQQQFDFSEIDPSIRQRVIERDIRFDITKQQVEVGLIELGRILIEQKADMKHGQWLKWLESKDISSSTAGSLIQISEKFSNSRSVGNLGVKVLQLLSQDSTPESARTESIELAEAGETLTIKDTKELIEAHKRIDTLQKELESAKSQIPTEDIKSKIKDLEKKLEAERNKPAVTVTQTIEVEPDDYKESIETKDRLIEEKCRLLNQIKKIKDSQAQEVASQVSQKLKALDDDFVLKNKQLESVQKRIDYLRESMKAMDKTAGDMVACKNACDKIRKHLFDISIDLRDLLEDHKITDSSAKEMRILCGELEQGAMAFRKYIDGFDDFIGIGEQA
jgi:hypothetical protein